MNSNKMDVASRTGRGGLKAPSCARSLTQVIRTIVLLGQRHSPPAGKAT